MDELTKINLLSAFAELTKKKVSDMVINFVTSDVTPEKRAEILYWFKEIVKQIESMDKIKQVEVLEEIFLKSKEEKFGKVSIDGFDIIKKDISEYEYPPEIKLKIEAYENFLKNLKENNKENRIKINEKYTYYLIAKKETTK